MKVLFMGTPEFAVEPLKAIVGSRHSVVAVISQPDRQLNKKGKLMPTAVKAEAEKLGLQVLQFENVSKDAVDIVKEIAPDIIVTVAYGQILSQEFIDIAPYGIYNVHSSLLPLYRGSSPIQSAMLDGQDVTGVTIMKTERTMDTGDIIVKGSIPITKGEPFYLLHDKLSKIGSELIVKALDDTESGVVTFSKQNNELATYTKKVNKSDGLINWCNSAEFISRQVDAYNPWPTAFTFHNGNNIKIYSVKCVDLSDMSDIVAKYSTAKCGEVLVAGDKAGLVVKTKDGALSILTLKAPGKSCLSFGDFLRGYKVIVGDRFNGGECE